jgi:hypothetical protein
LEGSGEIALGVAGEVAEGSFEAGGGDDGVLGMDLTLNREVNIAEGGAGTGMQIGFREEKEGEGMAVSWHKKKLLRE